MEEGEGGGCCARLASLRDGCEKNENHVALLALHVSESSAGKCS